MKRGWERLSGAAMNSLVAAAKLLAGQGDRSRTHSSNRNQPTHAKAPYEVARDICINGTGVEIRLSDIATKRPVFAQSFY